MPVLYIVGALAYLIPAVVCWLLSKEIHKRDWIEFHHIEWYLTMACPVLNSVLALMLLAVMSVAWHIEEGEE